MLGSPGASHLNIKSCLQSLSSKAMETAVAARSASRFLLRTTSAMVTQRAFQDLRRRRESLALAGPGERRCARAAARQGAATAGAPGFQAAAADPTELPRRSSRPALRRRRGVEPGAPGFQELHPAPRVQLAPRLRPRCGAGPGAPGFQVPHPAPQVQRAPGHLAGRRTPAAGLPRLDAEDGASARPTPAARGLVAGVRRHTARADEGLRWLAGALQLPVGVQLWPPHLPSGSAVGRAGAHRLAGRGR